MGAAGAGCRCVFCVASAGSWACAAAPVKVLHDGEMSSDSSSGPTQSNVLSSVFTHSLRSQFLGSAGSFLCCLCKKVPEKLRLNGSDAGSLISLQLLLLPKIPPEFSTFSGPITVEMLSLGLCEGVTHGWSMLLEPVDTKGRGHVGSSGGARCLDSSVLTEEEDEDAFLSLPEINEWLLSYTSVVMRSKESSSSSRATLWRERSSFYCQRTAEEMSSKQK